MLSRRRARSLIRGSVWLLTLGGLIVIALSLVTTAHVSLFYYDGRIYALESSAGAMYLNNLDSVGATGVGWIGDAEFSRVRFIHPGQIRWYPRLRTYPGPASTGFTLALPYWLPAAFVACLYIVVPWIRPRRGLCLECGYDLHGLTSDKCPECGTQFRAAQSKPIEPSAPTIPTIAPPEV